MNVSKFQTVVEVPKFRWKTGYSRKNIFMGSCFTENVGNRMAALKYDVDINPFGILYNPVSVANSLKMLITEKEFTDSDLIHAGGLWHSFHHHGKFSFPNKQDTLKAINDRLKSSAEFLKEADFLFITFGTAWIYRYKETGQTVSNCHKIPAGKFERARLSIAEIVEEYRELFAEVRKINPHLKVVFTVSPIRHWKDGSVENQRSKAILLLAIDQLIHDIDDDFCAYFPAYEIVMDELRDYRFYAEDMIHISEVAIDHIWEKFQSCLIEKESQQIAVQVQKVVKAMNHKPLHENTPEYVRFLDQTISEIIRLESNYVYLNLTVEKEYFKTEKNKIEQRML
jgi:hypothetical protein